jgi:uncharacterized membrane protein YbhN (UPF0104 family)
VEEWHGEFRALMRVGPLLLPVALGLAGYLLEATGLFGLARWGLRANGLGWGEAAFALAASEVLGTVSLIPGGLGVTDASLAVLLGILGLPFPVATAAALLFRASTLWLGTVLDAVCVLALHLETGFLSRLA